MKKTRVAQPEEEDQDNVPPLTNLTEDERDVLAYDKARASDDGMRISLERVRADLGQDSIARVKE